MPGSDRPVRLKDVARQAGVSPGLVSRLLNNDETLTVRAETREAVLEAVRVLNYVPNSTATALRRSRTDTIGLALEHVTNPLFRDIVRGAQDEASARGTALLLLDIDDLADDPEPFEKFIRAGRIDGLLLQGGYSTADIAAEYAERVPTVIVNSPGSGNAPGVSLEDALATEIATAHLLTLGHARLAFVAGSPGPASDVRFAGFRSAFEHAGLSIHEAVPVPGGWEAQDGLAAMEQILATQPEVTGIVFASAVAAMGALRVLDAAQVRIPEDISVVTIHNPWFVDLLHPPLTTVELPLYELGRASVEVLMEQVDRGSSRERIIRDPAPRLVVRSSTAPPRRTQT